MINISEYLLGKDNKHAKSSTPVKQTIQGVCKFLDSLSVPSKFKSNEKTPISYGIGPCFEDDDTTWYVELYVVKPNGAAQSLCINVKTSSKFIGKDLNIDIDFYEAIDLAELLIYNPGKIITKNDIDYIRK